MGPRRTNARLAPLRERVLRAPHRFRRIRETSRPLVALLAVAGLLSLGWSVAIAPFTGGDEDNHFAYTAWLASSGHPPAVSSGQRPYSTIQGFAFRDLGYLRTVGNPEARPPWHDVEERRYKRFARAQPPDAQSNGSGPNPLGKNPPLYYAYESLPWLVAPGGHLFGRLFLMRLASGLLLLATVTFMWLLAGEVFRRALPRTVATGVVALHPLLTYTSGIVTNDNLLATLWTLFFWLALRVVRLGLSPGRVAALAAVAAASILTHGRGLAIVPVFLITLLVALLRHRPAVRAALPAIGAGVAVLAVALVAYRVILANAADGDVGAAAYGGEVTLGAANGFNLRQFASFVWQFYLPKLGFMSPRVGPGYGFRQMFVETGFGSFASLEIVFAPWVYDLVQITLVGTAVALYTLLARHWPLVRRHLAEIVVLLAGGLSMLGLLHLASYRAVAGGGADPLITGRYLLPLVGLLGLAVGGVVALLPRPAAPYVGAAVLVGLCSLSLAGIGLAVTRFYA
jgi:4-amino-4-deoxy-L-arabinose transferase-like glycosyltransferase